MALTTNQTLIGIVLEWAAAERAVRTAQANYVRIVDTVGERFIFLDDHPDYQRSAVELERDRALLTEQQDAGSEVMEAEARASKLLAVLRLAADGAGPGDPAVLLGGGLSLDEAARIDKENTGVDQ